MGLTITIVNRTKNATTYLWNFGDGAISTDPSPTHTYVAAGAYVVTLTATGSGGSNTFTKIAIVTGSTGPVEFVATKALDILATSAGDAITLPTS